MDKDCWLGMVVTVSEGIPVSSEVKKKVILKPVSHYITSLRLRQSNCGSSSPCWLLPIISAFIFLISHHEYGAKVYTRLQDIFSLCSFQSLPYCPCGSLFRKTPSIYIYLYNTAFLSASGSCAASSMTWAMFPLSTVACHLIPLHLVSCL